MTTVAIRETGEVVAHNYDDPTGGRLVAWAEAAVAANQLAKSLCMTDFAPNSFKGNPGNATAAIMMGDELGMSPLAALRSIFVIHGMPSMYARTMVALAQSKGHEIWTEHDAPTKVTVCGRRKGSEHVERSEWTTERARKAGYTGNKKYDTNPQEMLYAKAASTVCRKIAADVLAAIPYTVEDLELEQAETVTVTRSEPTKVQRKKPEPAEPDLDAPSLTMVKAEPSGVLMNEPDPLDEFTAAGTLNPDPITTAQQKMLHALLNANELGDRDAGLAWIGGVLKREVDSTKTLTKADASLVIDSLNALDAQRADDTLGGEGE